MDPQPQTISQAPATVERGMWAARFLATWALAWGLVGCVVAVGFVLVAGVDPGPALRLSILFAEVVGFTALVSARMIFPLFVRLPYALSLLLQIMTVLSATVFGSAAILLTQPLFFARRVSIVAMIVLVNALIAVVVGIALYTYDAMRRQIEQSYQALREKEALDRELRVARDVQRELLPRDVPRVRGLELAGVCIPAVDVGGDYFDFLQLGDDTTGLVIADVSGKGVPAALLMAGLQASVRSLSMASVEPAQLNGRLNEILFRSSSASRYATMFLGFYHAATRRLSYSNAGHHPPLVVGDDGVRHLAAGGLPIGMFDGSTYTHDLAEFNAGDLLTLFTDGVTEAPGAHDEEFGESRLIELLKRHRTRPLDEIVAAVLDEIRQWSGTREAHDDITLVLARAR